MTGGKRGFSYLSVDYFQPKKYCTPSVPNADVQSDAFIAMLFIQTGGNYVAIIHRNKRDSHTNQDQPLSVPSACCSRQSQYVGAFLGMALNSDNFKICSSLRGWEATSATSHLIDLINYQKSKSEGKTQKNPKC